MGELNGKSGDGVEMMIENNIPSSFFLFFFFLFSFFFFGRKICGKHFKMIMTLIVK